MPIFDFGCLNPACGFEWCDHYVTDKRRSVACPKCGGPMDTIWRAFPSVVDDTICETVENLAPTPITFTSRSEKRLYLKQHGISEKVRHVGVQGSDKNPHTSRWV